MRAFLHCAFLAGRAFETCACAEKGSLHIKNSKPHFKPFAGRIWVFVGEKIRALVGFRAFVGKDSGFHAEAFGLSWGGFRALVGRFWAFVGRIWAFLGYREEGFGRWCSWGGIRVFVGRLAGFCGKVSGFGGEDFGLSWEDFGFRWGGGGSGFRGRL